MQYLLDHEEMKGVDTYSIKTIGIPSLVLMECAARAVAAHVERAAKLSDTIAAVAGSGNNGADAVAAVRILFNKGYRTAVVMAGNPDHYSEELKIQEKIVRNLGIPIYAAEETDLSKFDWIVDGLFGIGLTRPVQGHYAEVVERINTSPAKVCAVDIPSGIFADNGQILGCAVRADLTVTFGYTKLGLEMYPGALYAGKVYVEEIGFARGAVETVGPKVRALTEEDVEKYLPRRLAWSNKGTYGKLLVVAGADNMSGAAFFSAKAAYKTGVGLVKVMTPEANRQIIGEKLPEAILECYDTGDFDVASFKAQLDWADAIIFGPGLGKAQHVHDMLKVLLADGDKPTLIDADGLNVLSEHPEWLKGHRCSLVITPHLGEMSRLTGQPIPVIAANLKETCESFAKAYDLVCVLKDARTWISDGHGTTLINLTGNSGMSTGGSGDVLAGMIGGLICQHALTDTTDLRGTSDSQNAYLQGADLPDAPDTSIAPDKMTVLAALGAYLHGQAGDRAKKVCGAYGLLASDIIKCIEL